MPGLRSLRFFRSAGIRLGNFAFGQNRTTEGVQNRSKKIYVHALHTVHALPDLRVAAGRLGDSVSVETSFNCKSPWRWSNQSRFADKVAVTSSDDRVISIATDGHASLKRDHVVSVSCFCFFYQPSKSGGEFGIGFQFLR